MTRTDASPFHADFKLSITQALADQLAKRLATLTPHSFSQQAIQSLEQRPGVYLLWHKGHEVYVGKAQRSLPKRLLNHWDKINGRKNLVVGDMAFVCLYVDEDLDAAAPEKLLIKKYRAQGDVRGVAWNTNGFGNKDPGRHRDKSEVKDNHFDALYPVRLDFDGLQMPAGVMAVGDFLNEMKEQLPYGFRFERRSRSARDGYALELTVPGHAMTAEQAIVLVLGSLPEGWQATALPGYLILYSEQQEYPSAMRWWRRDGDEVMGTDHRTRLAPSAEIQEVDGEAESQDEIEG